MPDVAPDAPYVHVVLISFHSHVPAGDRLDALERFKELGQSWGGRKAGVLFWQVSTNLDRRKNHDVFALTIFASEQAFKSYAAHPLHRAFAARLSAIADWVVGDMFVEAASWSRRTDADCVR